MTDRATFGDFAAAVTRHLEQIPPPCTPPGASPRCGRVDDVVGGLRAVIRAMSGYAADARAVLGSMPHAVRGEAGPWRRAAAQASDALANAAAFLPVPHAGTAPATRMQHPAAAGLTAAAAAMTAGRDLLHTHVRSRADGTRVAGSEWAPAITSVPVARAALHEVAWWARRIAVHGGDAAVTGVPGTPEARRRLAGACLWLHLLAGAVGDAHSHQPVLADDLDLLHSIPANAPPPRRLPQGSEPIAGLCQGIISTAERVRVAARKSAAQAAWSSAMTVDSMRRVAEYSVVTSWNCQVILTSLADLPGRSGPDGLAAMARRAAQAADAARATWLGAARAWDSLSTDCLGKISPTAAEAGDLALWTGRLAYADSQWTPALGPRHAARPPGDLAARPGDVRLAVAALHHAAHTLHALAAASQDQVLTAARTGRLIVPTRSLPESFDIPYRLAPAPAYRAAPLVFAYDQARSASSQAADAVTAIAAAIYAPSRHLSAVRPGFPDSQAGGVRHDRAPVPPRRLPQPPGPVQRTLLDLDITDPADLERASAIDNAASQLILSAALDAQPVRQKVGRDLAASAGTAELISHLYAAENGRVPVALYPAAHPGRGGAGTSGRTSAPAGALVRAELPASPLAARQARAAIRQALSEHAHLSDLSGDTELLASELVANAAEHGNGPICLILREHARKDGQLGITCEVTDTAPAMPQIRPAGADSERGWGLAIVAAIAADSGVTTRRGGKTAWFTLTKSPSAALRARPAEAEA